MRGIDDKIIYALNTSIPTESFKGQLSANKTCTDLSNKLDATYIERNKFIKNCIEYTAIRVQDLKMRKENEPEDMTAYKNFKSEQRKVNILTVLTPLKHYNNSFQFQLRLMQSELNVEEIIKERTTKIFHERCRLFFN